MYQFDQIIFHNPDEKFDIDVAGAKLFALMKSPHAVDGCVCVCVSGLRLRLGYCKCMRYQSLVPSR
jgi:hypothetical protein